MAQDQLDVDVELLDGLPSVGVGIARALVPAKRGGPNGHLPERRVMVAALEQDAERFAAYSRVCGFTVRDHVPATWLHVLTFPLQVHLMAAQDFPLGLAGLVHVANSMTLHRPVGIDEEVTLSSSAADLRGHRSGTQVDLLGEARVGDEVVWTGRSTYLARGKRPSGSPEPTSDEAVGGQQNHSQNARETDETPTKMGVDPTALWRLPAGLGRDYAAVSGDVNPIHLSSLTAKAFGFPRAIAHGMWTHARALAALEGRLPPAYEVEVDFRKPVLLPSTVGFASSHAEGQTDFQVASKDGSRVHLTGSLRPLRASGTQHHST
ncbi:MaoC family dehydratase [Ornithinimicrobium cryptoxanthini]|uniref:MaoC-like domain-containing protein n=1 Tax=Ornithinimicrobium cryptoxanthini TaxID=2934161 RepID=A0ABY4YJJ8_9MICO|nr:MaoC/PaaZ C-terminal domain-containing protein [Ornithinimicrobium cryptoxanthini]USQ76975.1 hypothetical protein NF557_03375 [Ornithinimicrobium cryptoxanthini]